MTPELVADIVRIKDPEIRAILLELVKQLHAAERKHEGDHYRASHHTHTLRYAASRTGGPR